MRKFINLLALAVLLFVPWLAQAQNTLTIADGSDNNGYVPVYGFYADAYLRCQIVYPANDIAAATSSVNMAGGSITGITFYATQTAVSLSGTFEVKMMEISSSTLSSFQNVSTATTVYTGTVGITGNQMAITFTTPYTYNGGNLLVEVSQTTVSSNYPTTTFLGINQSGASVQGYSYTGISSISASAQNFMPKTTFTFTGGTAVTCPAVQSHSVSNITDNSATVSFVDDMNTGATYKIDYWPTDGDTTTVTTTNTSYTFSGLDANMGYNYRITVLCSATDASVAMSGTFATLCAGSTCDLTLLGAYGITFELYQNGALKGTYVPYTSGITVDDSPAIYAAVCSSDPVVVKAIGSSPYFSAAYSVRDLTGTVLMSGSLSNGQYNTDTITTPCPTCIPPSLRIDSTSIDEIAISWSADSNATLFAVYLEDSLVNDNVSNTTYTFTNLDANTAYTFKVQSICSATDSSVIVSINARTACGEITLPYFVDFEDAEYNGAWYPCWDSTIHAGTDPSVNNVRNHTEGGTYGMYLQATNSENYNLVVSPQIPTAGNNIYVRFWAYRQYGWIKAGVMTNPYDTSTFIPMVSIESGSGWNEYEFLTDSLNATATYYVAWMAYYNSTSSYGTQIGEIDDIYISEIPSCLRVSSIGVDSNSISSESITLTWVDDANAGSYTVRYWTAVSDTTSVSTSDTFYVFDNLNANTAYTFSVVANCSGGDAEAVNATFRTACGATPIPFVEGFEDANSLSCWQMVNCVSSTGRSTSYPHSGNGSFRFSYTFNPPEYLISPELAGTDNGVKVEFYYRKSSSYDETFKVGYSTTSDTVTAFTWGEEFTATSDYQLFSAVMPAGTKYVAVQYTANNALYLYLDDFSFLLPPDCMPVIDLYAGEITATSATIHWTAPEGQNNFIVRIDSTDINVTDTFYTFTSLDARTSYTVSVASDCSDTSDWTSTTLTTDCAGGSCELTIYAEDSYGDGWNGGTLTFIQNGAMAGTYSMAGQGVSSTRIYDTATVNVCSGIPVTYSWQAGQYDTEISYSIHDGGGAEVYNSATSGVNHNDSILDACPSCIAPSGVMATNIDSASVTFVWTEATDVIAYLISFDGQDYVSGYGGSEIYTGLTPNTLYTFSVKAVCTPGDTSAARTITVRTTCASMVLPFVESFESCTVNAAPSCWNVLSGNPKVAGYASTAHTGSNSLYMSGNNQMIATSLVPLAGDSIHVSFWADHYSGTLEAGVMTNPLFDSTFIPLITSYGTSNYQFFEFNTDTLPHDSSYYVAFRYSAPYNNVYIDDINIRKNDGCTYPTNIVVTPTAYSANLAWSFSGTTGSFAVEYRLSGDAWSTPHVVSTTTDSLTGLTPASIYEVRVGTICGTDTLWTTSTFQTDCALLPLPYEEDFDAYSNDVMPPCWIWSSSFATHWDGGVFLKSYHGGGSEYVVLPALDGAIAKLQVNFRTKVGTIAENDGILIGVADASGTLLAWLDTLQDPNHSRNNWVEHTVYFVDYTLPAGATRVAFAQLRNWGQWALIDDINIEELPDCYPVADLTGNNLQDPEATTFTWRPLGFTAQWQVYVDTVTVDIDSLATMPASAFTSVSTPSYTIPVGDIQGGGIYNIFVRSNCGSSQSNWVKKTFGAGTIIMNNSSTADTAVGCGFVVYDNGGPIAGYLEYTNSAQVLRTVNVGSQLEVFGGQFGWGDSPITFTIYDGEGTSGTVLYQKTNTGTTNYSIDSVIATSTTGSLTITFSVNGAMCHTGYEFYVRCTDGAICPRPTELQAEMTSATTANVSWNGTASNYHFYYRLSGANTWAVHNVTVPNVTLTGLLPDTTYDMYVVAICSATDSSSASVTRHLNSHYEEVAPPTQYTVTLVTANATMGSVSPTGTTLVDSASTFVAHAISNRGFHFVAWTESGNTVSTDEDYSFTVTADITLTATFEADQQPPQGIDDVDVSSIALYPNPATVSVTLTGIEGLATVTIVDLNGREVKKVVVDSEQSTISLDGIAQGAYFVHITGEQTSAIRKLIIK